EPAARLEVAGQELTGVLGVASLGRRREPDQVGEQDADHLALGDGAVRARRGGGRTSRRGQRRAALAAELGSRSVRRRADRAHERERPAALAAELPPGVVVSAASGTLHLPRVERPQRLEKPCTHDVRACALADPLEPVLLVEMDRRVVRLDAQAQLLVALCARLVDQLREQLAAEALPAPARHDRDRQLGRVLVDEPVARLVRVEQPVPRRADRLEAVDRYERGVARPAPAGDVALERDVGLGSPARVVGVPEHVAEEGEVLRPGGPDHGTCTSSVSWMRFPSGSNTSTIRTCPCSSTITPTSTPAARSRSASARTSGTVTDATPPSSPCASQSAMSMSPRRSWA